MKGGLDLDTMAGAPDVEAAFADDDHPHHYTRGGLTMLALGQVPKTGDVFERDGHRFEIVDMDANRVDRLLRNYQCASGVGAKQSLVNTPNTDGETLAFM